MKRFHRIGGGFLLSISIPLAAGCGTPDRTLRGDPSASSVVTHASIADRAACSSLCQCKQPLEPMCKAVAGMGFRYVDLSALGWAPHIHVGDLVKDFDKEASRVEAALKANGLRVSNLTFDAIEGRPWDVYQTQFAALVKLAARLKTRLINIMAPAVNCDRQEMAGKLRTLVAIAQREGVRLSVETHCNQITERPADALWMCRQVPGLGLTLDPSHYFAGPNQGAPSDELYPYVYGTGFRAGSMNWATIQMPWGTGPIPFDSIVRKLQDAGYTGYYVAEYIEGFNKLDTLTESRKFLQWAKAFGR